MHFKLLIAFVESEKSNAVMDAARKAGATGATVITHARGEGIDATKTFFGLSLETKRDVVLLLVEEHLSRTILETVGEVGEFENKGSGIAFQIDVEDAVGVQRLVQRLRPVVEEEI